MNIIKNKKSILLGLFLIIVAFILIMFPQKSSQGVKNGIDICLNLIIPSLFPFMVLTIFLSRSNIGYKILQFPAAPIAKLTGLRKEYVVLFIQGMIGGFPSGAKSVAISKEENRISSNDAEILVCFCTGAGPSFLISAIGCKMFLSPSLGMIIFVSNILSAFTLLILNASKMSCVESDKSKKTPPISVCFFNSVKDACSSLATICSMVILFSVAINFLPENKNPILSLFCGIIEVTSGAILLSEKTNLFSILATSAICGFNGLCVIMQIISICINAGISVKKFIKSRLSSAILNMFYTYLLLFAFPIEINQTYISTGHNIAPQNLLSPLPALLLMLCCFCFHICFSKIKNK